MKKKSLLEYKIRNFFSSTLPYSQPIFSFEALGNTVELYNVPPLPNDLQEFRHGFEELITSITPELLTKVLKELYFMLDTFHITKSAQLEVL